MTKRLQMFFILAALGASMSASAELYRWVDERGVTNYSNEPPPAASKPRKLTHVADTVSVYTPDETFMQAVKTMRAQSLTAMTAPEAPRNPVARIAAPPQSGYEQCLMAGRTGCEELYGGYVPAYHLPGVAVYPLHGVQPTRFPAPRQVVATAARARVGTAR